MLLYFCWRDDGILYSRGAVIQRTIEVSPAFFKPVSAEKKKCEHMQTEHAGGWIFFLSGSELCAPNIFKSEKWKNLLRRIIIQNSICKKKKNQIHNWIRPLLCLAQCCGSTSLWCGSGLDLLPWCGSGSGSEFFFFYADAVLDLYPTFHPDPDRDPDPSFQDFFCTNNVGPNLGGP